MQKLTLTCNNGDELLHRTKPRPSGDTYFYCNFCDRTGLVRTGFYACKNADINCDFDYCPTCYDKNMAISANEIEESKNAS